MTDDITGYIAAKLTASQKRGYAPATASKREMHNDRRIGDPVKDRPAEALYAAQRHLAVLAMDQPPETREAWLREVLEAMDLRRRHLGGRREFAGEACFPYPGTLRGYNQHLRTYTRPCAACASTGTEEREAKIAALGITDGGDVKWT